MELGRLHYRMLEYEVTPATKPSVDFLCFHGFMGSGNDWLDLVEKVAGQLKCSVRFFLFDLPGHGKSSDDVRDYQSCVQTLLDVVVRDEIKNAFVLGYSMGSRVATQLACRMVDCKGLIIESGTFGLRDEGLKAIRLESDSLLFKKVLDGEQSLQEFLEKWYDSPLFKGIHRSALFGSRFEQQLKEDPNRWQKSLNVLSLGCFESHWELVENGNFPVYGIYGELDTKYRTILDEMKRLSLLQSYCLVPGASHNVHLMDPDSVARYLATLANGEL